MSALLGKAGKKLFEKHLERYAPADPLYEFYTNDKGKQKRRKRELPPGLSARDARILRKLKFRAHYLDKGFSFCGLRFGWTFLIGLIPLVGDVADVALNYLLIVRPATKAEIPPWLMRRMMLNNAISAGVGFVPFVGDVILAVYKANSRNVALLEEFLRIRGEEFIKMGGKDTNDDDSGEPQKQRWWTSNTIKSGELSKADQEQVKPGAGMTALELKDSLPGLPPGAKNARPKRAQSGTPVASTSAPVVVDSNLDPVSSSRSKGKKAKDSGSGSDSSGFSFFGRGKKRTTAVKPEREATRDSRFIEGAMDSTDRI
ncbi:hypothetical protein M413DRAFT_447300 [Hebeloma cylindrosporum]|uniref:DUF4112 domain-containing protein n=1 Tax=Hebeloma cylindrosporum TaxID=76867 RepID=A0A0C3C6Y4_HEBCY|nr:hypothetical protein M413DRAFT_447300 [Hebeloma cylindrosporum h7]